MDWDRGHGAERAGKSEPGGCAAFGPLLEAYYHHALEPRVAQSVGDHAAGCAACGAALERFAATDRLIAAAPIPAPGPELRQRLAARIATARAHRSVGMVASTPITRETVVRESRHRQPMYLHDGETNLTLKDKELESPTRAMSPMKPPTRWRVATAAMAAVALVAVFAVLVHGFVAGRGATGPAAQQTVRGQWHTVDTMTYTSTATGVTPYPAFSPVNPSVVYEMTLSPASLRHSDDGGATWQALTLPIAADKVVALQIFPSPLDAHTVFLTVSVNCDGVTAHSVGKTHGGILADPTAGAGDACSTTYRSTDDGKTWKTPSFPLASIVSELPLLGGPTAEAVLQAQGSHLYALLSCGQSMFQCSGFTGYTARLAASSDGGASWSLVDAG
ncbi:MAG TPA: sialidase family protein, partial [Ktedonobacterales bacterium]